MPLSHIAATAALPGDKADPRARDSLKQEVAELDQLIEQILLASR
ncbi:MAG: hypothetical protein Q8N31_14485 [Reyranella sp.]|nr:hypothetical protein [Reyranella sp.]MDP3161224.1 hypothetical protein [Reyranella sp.]